MQLHAQLSSGEHGLARNTVTRVQIAQWPLLLTSELDDPSLSLFKWIFNGLFIKPFFHYSLYDEPFMGSIFRNSVKPDMSQHELMQRTCTPRAGFNFPARGNAKKNGLVLTKDLFTNDKKEFSLLTKYKCNYLHSCEKTPPLSQLAFIGMAVLTKPRVPVTLALVDEQHL